jgi:hypothetical protein
MNLRARIRPPLLPATLVGAVAALLMGGAIADDSKNYEATFNADGELIRPEIGRAHV